MKPVAKSGTAFSRRESTESECKEKYATTASKALLKAKKCYDSNHEIRERDIMKYMAFQAVRLLSVDQSVDA